MVEDGFPRRSEVISEAKKCGFYPAGFKFAYPNSLFSTPLAEGNNVLEYLTHQSRTCEGEPILPSDREILIYPQMNSNDSAEFVYGWNPEKDYGWDEGDLMLPSSPWKDYHVAGLIILSEPLMDEIRGRRMEGYIDEVSKANGIRANLDGNRVYQPLIFAGDFNKLSDMILTLGQVSCAESLVRESAKVRPRYVDREYLSECMEACGIV